MDNRFDTEDLDRVLQEVSSLLNYQHHIGIESYPKSEEMVAFLQIRPPVSDVPDAPARDNRRPQRPVNNQQSRPLSPQEEKSAPSVPAASLADISQEVESCTNCALRAKRVVPVAGEGSESAKLLVVGEWLALPGNVPPPAGSIFGPHQDQMLTRMLEAIQLSRKDVFVTNIIKCGVEEGCQPKAEHATACFSYLQHQIRSLQPQLICSMGRVATRMILGKKEPLSRLRGKIHQYPVSRDVKIPVIPTYHPSFLLQNPEMKKATWIDLQLVAKTLGISL